MTWLLPETNWMFIHIPKTGGTSINKSLKDAGHTLQKVKLDSKLIRANLNPDLKQIPPHSKLSEMINCGLVVHDYNYFAQVRNPYTRIVSLYYFAQQQDLSRIQGDAETSRVKKSITWYKKRHSILNNMTFTQFVEKFSDDSWRQQFDQEWLFEPTTQLRYGWQRQHEWLDGADVKFFKLEKSDKIVKFIHNKGVDVEYKHYKNQGIRNYMDHYTPQTRDIVHRYFKEDFERYEYSR